MFGSFRKLFRKQPSAANELEIGVHVAELVSSTFAAAVEFSGFDARLIPKDETAHPIIGFVAGSCDVLTQAYGAQPDIAAFAATEAVLQSIFGEGDADIYCGFLKNAPNRSSKFNSGVMVGETWANLVLNQETDRSAILMARLFGEVYSDYCTQHREPSTVDQPTNTEGPEGTDGAPDELLISSGMEDKPVITRNGGFPAVTIASQDNPTAAFSTLQDFYVANCPEMSFNQAEALWALYRGGKS